MADKGHATHQLQVHTTQHHPQHTNHKSHFNQQHHATPSTTKILAIITMLPIGGTLLTLAGLLFAGTLTSLTITFPLFILFSPVLIPASLAIGLAVTGILTSGVFGLSAISSLSWVLSYLKGSVPEQLREAKRGMHDMSEYVGGKTKEVGETIQSKVQEAKRGDVGRNSSATA